MRASHCLVSHYSPSVSAAFWVRSSLALLALLASPVPVPAARPSDDLAAASAEEPRQLPSPSWASSSLPAVAQNWACAEEVVTTRHADVISLQQLRVAQVHAGRTRRHFERQRRGSNLSPSGNAEAAPFTAPFSAPFGTTSSPTAAAPSSDEEDTRVFVAPPPLEGEDHGTEGSGMKINKRARPRWELSLIFMGIILIPLALVFCYIRRASSSRPAPATAAAGSGSSVAPGGALPMPPRPDPTARQLAFAEDRVRLKVTVFIAALCHFCMSYNTGIIAGAMLYIQNDRSLQPLDAWTYGAIVSFMLVGAGVGAACGFVADWIGRRVTLLFVAVTYVVGDLIMALAHNVTMLTAGRAIAGLGVGLSSGLVSLYISEIAPADARGQLGSWAPLLGTFGLAVSYAVSTLLGLLPGGLWRLQLGLGMCPAILVLLLSKLLPETPRWLISQGRKEDARASLKALFPSVSEQTIGAELDFLQDDLDASLSPSSAGGPPGILALIWKNRKPFSLGITVNILQQATGINVIIYYGPTILKIAGFSNTAALLTTLAISVAQFSTVLANVAIVDRFGRRPVTIAGILVIMIGIMLIISGFLLRASKNSVLEAIWPPWIVVAGMFLFRASFSFSLSPLPYIMTSELFPQEAKSLGVALTWMSNWAANFVVCQLFPVAETRLVTAMGFDSSTSAALIFIAYLVCTFLALGFVVLFLPEGHGDRHEAIKA